MEKYDIVIIGAGPVGLMLGTIMQRWGYKVKHIDNRAEPTVTGRADGIQPRSLDLLRNMGLLHPLMAFEPARVYEVAFWDPSPKGITRTGTWASCPKFIDARYPFTALLHQGYIEKVFIEDIEKNGGRIQRPWTITGFENNGKDPEYPVEVNLEHVEGQGKETVKAKYLFSGEGARSFVREKLQVPIHYKDPIAYVWGVMDGVVRTDFPDIKVCIGVRDYRGRLSNYSIDEVHYPFGRRFNNGHPTREQHGPSLYPDCLINRQGLEPEENSNGEGSPGLCKEDLEAILHRMGSS